MKLSEVNNQHKLKLSDVSNAPIGGSVKSIPAHENVLGKAAKMAMGSINEGMNPSASTEGSNPLSTALNMGVSGMSASTPWQQRMGQNMQSSIINESTENPMGRLGMHLATDIGTGLMLGGPGMAKGAGEMVENVKNPSKVFGRKLGSLQSANPKGKVDFLSILSRASDDPMAGKVLQKSGVLEKFGGQNLGEGGMPIDKLANLTLEDSQNLLNDIKAGVRKAVKEGDVKSTEIGIAKMFKELAEAQKATFPGLQSAKSSYGFAKNLGKGVKSVAKVGALGAAAGAGGTLGHTLVKSFIPK